MQLLTLIRFATLIALRRTTADWRLQAGAGLGMVLAVTLMASSIIYSEALEETALDYTLRNASAEEVNLRFQVFHALERRAFDSTRQFMEDQVAPSLRPYLRGQEMLISTATFFFEGLPQLELADAIRPRGRVHAVTAFEEHVRVVQGRLPRTARGELEVVIDSLGASTLVLQLGQQFELIPPVQGIEMRDLTVRVVGIVEPLDPSDSYWQEGYPVRLTETKRQWTTLPLYTEKEALLGTVGEAFPGLLTDFFWLFFLDQDGLRASQVGALQAALSSTMVETRTNIPDSSWTTELDQVLKRYNSLLTIARIPLLLVVFLSIGVLLYYLFLIASLLGRVRAREVAMLRSRGASTPQVGMVILVEGLLLAAPAVIAGPFLAQGLVRVTSRLIPGVSEGVQLTSVDISPLVFLLGLLGGLLAVAVFTSTILGVARQGVVELRRAGARPPETPFFHRYHLDLVLLALMGITWWQLKSRGTFLAKSLTGEGVEINMALLLGPILGVVAVALLLLRLLPLGMRALAWLLDPFAPVWLAQGLLRASRDPIPVGSLLILLALATSLGVLSSVLLSTLERSQREQALYEAGADLRIGHSLGSEIVRGGSMARFFTPLPGVTAAADAMRLRITVLTTGFGQDTVLLAVDPEGFPKVAWTRPDFVGAPLGERLEVLRPPTEAPRGIPIAANATLLGLWVETGLFSPSASLMARLQDGRGAYFDMVMGDLSGRGWRYLEAPIQPFSFGGGRRRAPEPEMEPPYVLHTLWVSSTGGDRTTGALFLDGLQAITPEGPMDLATFQGPEGWHALEDASAPGLYALELSKTVARPGRLSTAFTWGEGGLGPPGIRAGPPEAALPALVNEQFLTMHQVHIGDVLPSFVLDVAVPLRVVGTVDLFPSLDVRETSFMVANLGSVLEYLALRTGRRLNPAGEVWIKTSGATASLTRFSQVIEERNGRVLEVYDAGQMVANRRADPLLTAAWAGLLALAFITVVLASSTGLILYTYIDARERQREFALLRSLGFSRLQVNAALWFNLALVVSIGLTVGTLGGYWLARALLPLLEVAEGGAKVIPSMALQNNWTALIVAYAVIAGATLVTVLVLAWAVSRLQIQRLLRVEGV